MQGGNSPDSFTFTVGKLDAGMAILLGERAHLIEFPSILLPPGATTGSIVNIAVHRNVGEEKRRDVDFWALQDDILKEFGTSSPEPPQLKLRNVTQTSVTLEWPTVQLANARLRSLDIYRNGQRLASIPSPMTNTSTKLSGLEINNDYTFQLVLRTTAGTYPSNILRVRTHTMSDTSGISVCFGNVQDSVLLENAKLALREMKAKWSDKIQIDTTHFVCTTPAATPGGAQAAGNAGGAPGIEYQRALQLSIPVVQPQWILACHSEKKMIPIAAYYLGAPTTTPVASAGFNRPQSMSQVSVQQTPGSPPPRKPNSPSNRASMPAPSRSTSTFVNQPANSGRPAFEATQEEGPDDPEARDIDLERTTSITSTESKRKSYVGTMNRDFKFPSPTASPNVPEVPSKRDTMTDEQTPHAEEDRKAAPMSPTNIEVPPPPPMEKEQSVTSMDDSEDDVGDTVDIPLN